MQQSTVTTKGQTTLPREVRAALGINPGDKVRYVIHGDEVRIMKLRPGKDLVGFLADKVRTAASLDDMQDAIAQGAVTSGKPAP